MIYDEIYNIIIMYTPSTIELKCYETTNMYRPDRPYGTVPSVQKAKYPAPNANFTGLKFQQWIILCRIFLS